ncbi:MAG TPA: polysaccharide biosynthesis/export family protein [Verrucomicrobiae bacterium]|nr:polysaccharide biosynthesis/export family protein [Verrucomicrobiae bacterium]
MNRLIIPLVVAAIAASGCSRYSDLPPGTRLPIKSAIVEQQPVVVKPVEPQVDPSPDYVLGAGDIFAVNVGGRPELSVGVNSAGASGPKGCRVDGSGIANLPMIGGIRVGGLTVPQAQEKISKEYRKFLKDPWVVIEVVEYRSRPLYLLGQFRKPGVYYMDRPVNLLQALGHGDGFDAQANIRSARFTRGGKTIPVDLYELLVNGDQRQNVWLQPGDAIYLPDTRNQQIFVFGAVKKPGPVPIPPSGLNLSQAIANAELRETGYNFRYVRIIRSFSATKGELLVVDFDRIMRGEALPVELREGDIVYVPKSGTANWNDAISEMLPSLQAVSAVINPFVLIKVLGK